MENIVDTFANGLKNVAKNPILFVPALIFALLSFSLTLIQAYVSFFNPEFLENIYENYLTQVYISENLWTIIAIVFAGLILSFLINAFFSAGQIGMSKEAVEKGKTSLSDFFSYGGRYIFRVFLSLLLLSLLQCIAVIFWSPLYYVYSKSGLTLNDISESILNLFLEAGSLPDSVITMLLLFFIGLLLALIYFIILAILFYFVSYAIVIDDMPVFASFKKSFALLKQYPGKVLIFIIALVCIMLVISIAIQGILTFLSLFLLPVSLVSPSLVVCFSLLTSLISSVISGLISAVTVVWVARFYMAITEKEF